MEGGVGLLVDGESSNIISMMSTSSIDVNNSIVTSDLGSVIEVIIEDNTMLLGIDNTSTVSSVAQSAYTEYLSFHPGLSPRRLKYVKDERGRLLAPNLSIRGHQLGSKFEVVIEDFVIADGSVKETDFIKQYRLWQIFASKQVVDYILKLSSTQSLYIEKPNVEVLVLLKELIISTEEEVQINCLKALQMMQSRYPQKDLFILSVKGIAALFRSTQYATVAIAALNCFIIAKNIVQYHTIDRKLLTWMDIESALSRFPKDQKQLMSLFDVLKDDTTLADNGILGEDDVVLSRNVSVNTLPLTFLATIDTMKNNQAANFQQERAGFQATPMNISLYNQNTKSLQEFDARRSDKEYMKGNRVIDVPDAAFATINKQNGRMGLSRLISLIESEEASVRAFALDKLLKTILSSKQLLDIDDHASVASSPKKSLSLPSIAATDGTDMSMKVEDLLTSDFEVQSVVRILMQCLQKNLHSRAASRMNSVKEPSQIKKSSSVPASVLLARNPSNNELIPKAERLIKAALQSSETDLHSVCTSIYCIFHLMQYSSKWRIMIVVALQDWIKLLVTLAHAHLEDLAEAAGHIAMAIISESHSWVNVGAKLDAAAIRLFISSIKNNDRTPVQRIRIDMAMTYMMDIATYVDTSNTKIYNDNNINLDVVTESLTELETVLLFDDNYILKNLWSWGVEEELEDASLRSQLDISIERSVSKKSIALCAEDKDDINVESLKILSTASVVTSVSNYLNKKDAIGKLLLLLSGCTIKGDAPDEFHHDYRSTHSGSIPKIGSNKSLLSIHTSQHPIDPESDHHVNASFEKIRYILKMLANLSSSADSTPKQRIKAILKDMKLNKNNDSHDKHHHHHHHHHNHHFDPPSVLQSLSLESICRVDPISSFYYTILVVERS